MDNQHTPPTGDQIHGQIGDNAQHVAVGSQIHQETHIYAAVAPSTASAYSQYRPQRKYLHGRDELRGDLAKAIVSHPRCVLAGLPGVGKSALAFALLEDIWLANHFGDQRYYLIFGPNADHFNLLGALLLQLDIDPAHLNSVDLRAVELRRQLHARSVLLVLDDVWQIAHAQPILDACHPTQTHLFITTRSTRLAPDLIAMRLSTPLLDLEASLEMLGEGGEWAATAVHTNREGARQLVEAAGKLPLALEVLGRQLDLYVESEGVDAAIPLLLEKLTSAQATVLGWRSSRRRPGLDEAEPSLEAVIQLSIQALPTDAVRHAFYSLAPFGAEPLTFDAAAQEAVWQCDAETARSHRQSLMAAGLLQRVYGHDVPRFGLHQILNFFAQYRLEAKPDAARAAYLAHAAHYAQIVSDWDTAIDEERMTYAKPLEWEQVSQALEWLCAATDNHEDADAAQALLVYSRHWRNVIYNNHSPQRSHWLEAATQSAQRHGDDWDRANTLQAQGDVFRFLDRNDEALARYEQALQLFQTVGDRLGEANTLQAQGQLFLDLDQAEKGLTLLEQARQLYVAVGAQAGLANVGITLARHAAAAGDFGAAIDYMQPAADFGKAIGHPLGEQLQAEIDGWRQQG